jgi:hypothetical protein
MYSQGSFNKYAGLWALRQEEKNKNPGIQEPEVRMNDEDRTRNNKRRSVS